MANEMNFGGIGGIGIQGGSDSTYNITQIIGISPEFAHMKTQLHDMEQLLALLPEEKEQERNELSARIYKHKELIESFKSDVLKLAESFSRIEINTDRLRRAKEHFDKGEITEARVVLEDALEEMADEKRGLLAKKKEFEEDTVPKLQSKADEYLILAQTTALNYESSTRIADAKKYFEDSIECAASFKNLFAFAAFLWQHSEFRRAIEFWQRTLEIAQNSNDKQGEGYCLGNLGNAYQALGEFQQAIEFHWQSLEIMRKIGDRFGEGRILGCLGSECYLLGEYQKAIDFHEQALAIARKIGDRQGEGNSLASLGLTYYSLGEYRKAIEYLEQALTIARATGDRLGETHCLGNLGAAFRSLGEYQKAIEFHEQRLEIAREIGDRLGEKQGLVNLGNVYYTLGEFQKAMKSHEQALAIARDIGDRLGEGNSLGNLGLVYDSLGEYRKAIEYHEQALAISRAIGDRLGEGQCFGNLGLAYDALGEKEKTCNNWRQALAIFETIGVPEAKKVRELMQGAGCGNNGER